MKLRTKLLISFTMLFFVVINVFGFTLIQVIFYTSLNNSIDSGFREYNIIYSNLKTGEMMSRQFFDVQDIIALKNKTYLQNSDSKTIDIEVMDKDKNVIFSSMVADREFGEAFYKPVDEKTSNYMISEYGGSHSLAINRQIQFNEEVYYLTYTNDIEQIYSERRQYIFLLLLFNVIGGVISVFIIYYFTRTITQPLQKLVDNIDEIIHKNHYAELKQNSNIKELNMLTDNFNIMSRKISIQMDTLEQANQQKQRFIDSLTHEIRTPLTSIIGYSSLCVNRQELEADVIQQAFENIHKNGKRIENLTENLIKLITMDKTPLNLKEIHVGRVLAEMQESFAEKMKEEKIEFHITGEDMMIVSDEYFLGMLFSNFIDNAIKAVSGRVKKQIEVRMEGRTVMICDNGKGMEKEDLEKIFEPFYMADKSRKRDFEGFGLGLSICRSIMDILNIGFDVKSKLHVGTEIVLTFPGGAYEKN